MKTYQEAEEITLVFSGDDYFEKLERLIDQSSETLHLQTYIFASDATGQRIVDALKRAVERQVKVFMMVDAYGSYPFSNQTKDELISGGINFRLYSRLFSSESIFFGRRLHHKIIVADKRVALTGGINIADKYSGKNGDKPWLDYAVLTTGKACEELHLLCEHFYKKRGRLKPNIPIIKHGSETIQPGNKLIRFRRNDWIKGKNEIHKSYAEAIISAKSCITIVASYFLPGATFRKLLKDAAARGVEIKIILAGQSDISSLRLAESYMYDFYLKNNIRIYEWTDSVMHGKAMIVDTQWATIGSYNLNFLSHYISIELNADIIDKSFVRDFDQHLRKVMQNNCESIPLQPKGKKDGWWMRFRMWVAYLFYRSLMRVMMMGRKHKHKKH